MVRETTNQIQQLRIGAIPEGWDITSIGDHFDFKNGLNKEKKYFGAGTPIVNYLDVFKNPGIRAEDIDGKVTVSSDELRSFSVRKGDVLFTRTSETINEIGMSSAVIGDLKDTVFSGFLLRARPKTNFFDLHFKKYCFRSHVVRRQITSTSTQTTRALTNGRLLTRVLVPVPSNPQEQYAIAEILSDTDELISHLDKLIIKKMNVKNGIVQELITGNKRLPGFSSEWVVHELGEMTSIIAGGTPSTRVPEYWGGDIRWMNSGELNNKKIHDVEGRITHLGLTNSSTSLLPEKCVLIGLAGQGKTRGTVAINLVELCTNQSIAGIIPNESFIPELLYYNLDSRYDELRNMSTGVGGRASLNLGILRRITVRMPSSKEEQRAIAEVLSDVDSEIQELNNERYKYIMLKKGMAQKLLTGRIRLR